MLNKISLGLIFVLAIFAPLGFTTLTAQGMMFDKVFLLVATSVVLLFLWVAGGVAKQELVIAKTPFDYFILAAVAALGFSTFFSSNVATSLLGGFGRPALSLLGMLAAALFFIISQNELRQPRAAKKVTGALTLASTLAVLFAIVQSFGVRLLPFQEFAGNSVNTLGTPITAAVVAAIFLPIIGVFLATSANKLQRLIWSLSGLILLGALVLFNFGIAWIVAAVGAGLMFLTSAHSSLPRPRWFTGALISVIALAVFSLSASGLSLTFGFSPQIPPNVSISQGASFELAKQALTERFAFGTGPGNFDTAFMRFRPDSLNQTIVWNVRFQEPASYAFEYLMTTGAFGALTALALVATLLFVIWRGIVKGVATNEDLIRLSLSVALTTLVVTAFMLPFNSALIIIGLILSALFIALSYHALPGQFGERRFALKISFGKSFVFSGAILGAIVLVVFGLSFLTRIFVADMVAAQGLRNSDPIQGTTLLRQATDLVPWREYYLVGLTQRALEALGAEAVKETPNTDNIQALMSQALQASNALTRTMPASAVSWQTQGLAYETLSNYVSNPSEALTQAAQSFETASRLETNNPVWSVARARVARLSYERAAAADRDPKKLDEAAGFLDQARESKPDFAGLYTEEAALNEAKGELTKAISAAVAAYQLDSSAANGIVLGRLVYNRAISAKPEKDDLLNAEQILSDVLLAQPNLSNARYILGLVYEKQGKADLAKDAYDKLLSSLTDTRSRAEVEARLAALGKKPAVPPSKSVDSSGLDQERKNPGVALPDSGESQ